MEILAAYQPKLEELRVPIAQLAIAYFILCAMAYRMKLSVPLATALMAAGCGIAITPDVLRELHSGSYGHDVILVITAYLYVDGGTRVAFAGMSVAIVIYAVVAEVQTRIRRGACGQLGSVTTLNQKPPPIADQGVQRDIH